MEETKPILTNFDDVEENMEVKMEMEDEEVEEVEDYEEVNYEDVDYEDVEDEQFDEEEEIKKYKLEMGIKTMSDEFGEYDVPASRQQEHEQTTTRLVTEFLEKTGASMNILESEAFHHLFHQLNPAAHVPTEDDVRDYLFNPQQLASPTACIVCGAEKEECDVLSLSVQEACLVLTTTIMALNRDANEAATKILSASLRCCVVHMNELCRFIIRAFELDELRDFKMAPQYKIGEWCIVYKRIKKRKERFDNPNFGPSNLRCVFSAFLAEYSMDPPHFVPPPLEFERMQADLFNGWEDVDLNGHGEVIRKPGYYLGQQFSMEDSPDEEEDYEEEEREVEIKRPRLERPEVITLPNGKKVVKMDATLKMALQSALYKSKAAGPSNKK